MSGRVTAVRSAAQVAYYLTGDAAATSAQVGYLLGEQTDARTVGFIGAGQVPDLLGWPVGQPVDSQLAAGLVFAVASGVNPRSGERIIAPRLRVAEVAKLSAAPAVAAVLAAAETTSTGEAARLFVSDHRRRLWARTVRQVGRVAEAHTAPVTDLALLLDGAGVHPYAVFGKTGWEAAWALRRERIDTATALHALRFETPKSVGLAVVTANTDHAQTLIATWTQCVHETMDALMADAGYGMTGHHGDGQTATRIHGTGWAGTCTVEMTSRAGDPHLHAHVMVANATRCVDGTWRAIGAGGAELRAGGAVANARAQRLFRHKTLSAGLLGWVFDRDAKGWRVAGVTTEAEALFSKRHQAISATVEQARQGRRTGSHRVDAAAEASTRGPKDPVVETLAQIRARVLAEAEAAGVPIWADDPGPRPDRAASPAQWMPERWVGELDAMLTEHASVVCERDVWRCVHTLAPPEWTDTQVAAAVAAVLAAPGLIRLPDATGLPGQLAGAARYTTATILAAEETVFALSAQGVGRACHTLSVAEVAYLLDGYEATQGWEFTPEQRRLGARFLAGGNAVDVADGGPGSGKTSVMDAVRMSYEAAGLRVFGVSTSAAAAANLGTEAAMDTATIAGLLAAIGRGRAPAMDVLIIDEASMAGVRDLAALLSWATTSEVDVRMIGDTQQLGSVAAGNTYPRHIAQLNGVVLRTNNRQHQAHDRDAVARLQGGETFDALALYAQHGQVNVAMTDPGRVNQLVAGWATDAACYPDPLDRANAVAILAVRRDRVAQLNTAARAHARANGWLGPDTGYRTPGRGTVTYAVGDPILLKKNDYHRPAGQPALRNNTLWVVQRIDPNTKAMTITRRNGRTVEHATLEPAYVAAHTRHGYATTTHAAQGRTTDHTHVVPDDADPNALLVQASRHRHGLTWYLDGGGLTESRHDWRQLAALSPTARVRWATDRLAHRVGAFDDEREQGRQETMTAHDALRRPSPGSPIAPVTPRLPAAGAMTPEQRTQVEKALAARRRWHNRQLADGLLRGAVGSVFREL
jgi:conjugative relaxase-like TrwC/TraI family protein